MEIVSNPIVLKRSFYIILIYLLSRTGMLTYCEPANWVFLHQWANSNALHPNHRFTRGNRIERPSNGNK